MWHARVVCPQSTVKVRGQSVNLVATGGHVDTLVDHVVTYNELASDHVSTIMHRWRQHHFEPRFDSPT